MTHVFGSLIDEQTRCTHYHGADDVVAIKFLCCDRYYPCFRCHAEHAGHPSGRWPPSASATQAVLCGVCRTELSIATYRQATGCPHCGARFNERCVLHHHLYFA